jgi:hypothetical protein
VARISASDFFSSLAIARTCFSLRSMSWYFISKPRSGSTAPSFGTRSRTWPYDAITS